MAEDLSESDSRRPLTGVALAVGVAAISFAAIFFKKAQPTHPLVSAALRLSVASALLLPFVIRAALRRRLDQARIRLGVLAGLCYGVHFGAWVASLGLTSVAASVTLVTVSPLLLAVVGHWSGRDAPDRRTWLALVGAVGGVVVIANHDLSAPGGALYGDLLALLGAAAMAGYLLVGRRVTAEMGIAAFSGIATGVGAITLLLTALCAGIPIVAASPEAMGYLVLAALVPQLIGHTLLTWAVRHTTPTIVGTATLAEPVGATALGWLWLGESVDWPVALGCAITLACVVAGTFRRRPAAAA